MPGPTPKRERTLMNDATTTYRASDLAELIATAPPLTPETLDQLRRLLEPGRRVATRDDVELAA